MLLSTTFPVLLPFITNAISPGGNAAPAGEYSAESPVEDERLREISNDELVLAMRMEIAEVDWRINEVLKFADEFDGSDSIVAIMPQLVIYATGQRGRVGDVVRLVDGTERVIERIDYAKREVVYHDGVGRLFSDHGMLSEASAAVDRVAELRKHLRAGRVEGEGSGSRQGSASRGTNDNDFRRRLGDR